MLDVDVALPDKTEQVMMCRLTPEQVKAYRTWLKSDELKVFACLLRFCVVFSNDDSLSANFGWSIERLVWNLFTSKDLQPSRFVETWESSRR